MQYKKMNMSEKEEIIIQAKKVEDFAKLIGKKNKPPMEKIHIYKDLKTREMLEKEITMRTGK